MKNQNNEEIQVETFISEEELENDVVKSLKAKLLPDPEFLPNFDNFIVVDNLPIVKQDKYEKLLSVIHKIYVQFDETLKKDKSIILPVDPTTTETKGFAFIEFSTPKKAEAATLKTEGHKLDKAHIFKVSSFNDFSRFETVPDVYEPPQLKETNVKENLRWWLSNPNEQFVLRYADETEVFWNDVVASSTKSIVKKNKWTDKFVEWSSQGSFLVTIHNQGLILWGGENWTRIHRLQHPGVASFQFSPQERYLVSFSQQYHKDDNPNDPLCYIVWDAINGKKCRGFPAISPAKDGNKKDVSIASWPAFKWSFDDKYFARIGVDSISIFEAPSMAMVNKKSIKISNVRSFEWSPSAHLFVCWTEETTNTPAKVVVYSVPSCEVVFQKTFFTVKDCTIYWQDQGKYFCVKVDRYIKKNKKTQIVTSIEIFSTVEKNFPTEVLAIPEKEKVTAFSWEPKGTRFAIIHAEQSAHGRFNVSFYQHIGTKLEKLKTLENKPANMILWSPLGKYILLAGIKEQLGGNLEFFNVDMMESMREATHDTATRVSWDPSGRFVCTSSSYWDQQSENGYIIWSFKGDQLNKLMKDKFYQFLWRPRPPSLLSAEKEDEIKSKLKEYTKKYRKIVKASSLDASQSRQLARKSLQKEFDEIIKKWADITKSEKAKRDQIRGYDSDEEDLVEDSVEVVEDENIIEIGIEIEIPEEDSEPLGNCFQGRMGQRDDKSFGIVPYWILRDGMYDVVHFLVQISVSAQTFKIKFDPLRGKPSRKIRETNWQTATREVWEESTHLLDFREFPDPQKSHDGLYFIRVEKITDAKDFFRKNTELFSGKKHNKEVIALSTFSFAPKKSFPNDSLLSSQIKQIVRNWRAGNIDLDPPVYCSLTRIDGVWKATKVGQGIIPEDYANYQSLVWQLLRADQRDHSLPKILVQIDTYYSEDHNELSFVDKIRSALIAFVCNFKYLANNIDINTCYNRRTIQGKMKYYSY